MATLTFPQAGPASADAAVAALCSSLVERGLCDGKTIERARRVAEESGQRPDRVLTQLGLVSEQALAETVAALLGLQRAVPQDYPSEPLFPDRLKAKFLRKAKAVPLAEAQGMVLLAMADPFDPFTRQAVAAALGRQVEVRVALPIELEAALERLYPDPNALAADPGDVLDGEHDASREEDAERLKDLASEAPVIRLVNQMIGRAVETQASDIHIEPFEDKLRIRYRYDGVLQEAEPPPSHLQAAIISRIKIMSRLDIAERRLPQDGRLRLAVRGQDVDFRVSTVPSLHGETVVLRILDRNAVAFDYAHLGLPEPVTAAFRRALEQPNGMVLVTGPTGSGKTTTLYTGLLQLNSVVRKVVTVEDPIEYQLAGINQIQVKPQIGLTFATLLRSILRQDPDVVMIGEIRDLETAQIAVQASLTGHLVLSTLHTNSAAATITRLRDMGLEDYLLTATLKGVLAQRLVRRLCPQCRQPYAAPGEMVERFRLDRLSTGGGPIMLHRAVGCPACRGTGYRGRRAIAEFLLPDERIERLVFSHADHGAIEHEAVAAGMIPMFDAGLLVALTGETTVEEVVRAIRAAEG
ncbi:ATPase, T2SS/T4P/T4SS family [Telmatospirillum sp.]|uniref:GspE/PulE family protein n=1 Tax=Telmatospirillum sp. TaxID=2079197 RepID=UPI0028428F8B|nr:ATPase, T2SS/T4P/T4SS family [Telmatospirillum sp.]MDR3436843.1 ATPase, T2SS/T4P/T4SS family [Telmatospirillum sp.]